MMKDSHKRLAKSIALGLIGPGLVMGILLLVYALKGVYPFGTVTVDYFDMGQMNAPMYHHVWDALRGHKSLFFDWYTGLGINMAESVSLSSLVSPFNLFFYFVPREYILQSLSIFTMIKMMAMAGSMHFFLRKQFKINTFWCVLFGIAYSFCGFVLQYYTNSQWLDAAAVLPLLCWGVGLLLFKNKLLPYTLTLAAALALNLYCGMMMLLLVFFISGLYLVVFRQLGRGRAMTLGLGTVLGLGLSAVVLLPGYVQMMESSRVDMDGGGGNLLLGALTRYLHWVSRPNGVDATRWLMLFGLSLAFVIIIFGFRRTKNRRVKLFTIGAILMVVLQLYFEGINLIWHFGSYMMFPVRFGYMITMVVLACAGYFVSKNEALNQPLHWNPFQRTSLRKIIYTYLTLIGASLFVLLLWEYRKVTSASDPGLLVYFQLSFLALGVLYAWLLFSRKRQASYRLVSVFLVVELLFGAYIYLPPPNAAELAPHAEQTSEFIGMSNTLAQSLHLEPSRLDRVKNYGGTLNTNYPFVLQRPAVSNWSHSITGAHQGSVYRLGYLTNYTRLWDTGGTVFSDALLHINHVVTTAAHGDEAYRLDAKYGAYRSYESLFQLPFGLVVPSDLYSVTYSDVYDYQNQIFAAISGFSEPLIQRLEPEYTSELVADETKRVSFDLSVQGRKLLYYYNDTVNNVRFSVDGKAVFCPITGDPKNRYYNAGFAHILYLDGFEDETVRVSAVCRVEYDEADMNYGLLDLDLLERFTAQYAGEDNQATAGNHSLTLTVNADPERDMLFLPLNHDPGWRCTVNGQAVRIETVLGTLMGIPLQQGENQVSLTFRPKSLDTGLVITLLSALMLAGGVLLKKRKIRFPKRVLRLTDEAFGLLWGLAVILVYGVPVAYGLLHWLMK